MSKACLDNPGVHHDEMLSNLSSTPHKETSVTDILIADDQPLIRDGLAQVICTERDLRCCAQASTVAETQSLAVKHKPDMVIMDIRIKRGDGLELIRTLKSQRPVVRVIILSEHTGALQVERALRAGAQGYVSKAHPAQEVLKAIRKVLAGQVYLTRGMAELFLNRFVGGGAGATKGPAVEQLTDRELHVFQLLGIGLSTREIATDMNRSFKTIESHRENIKRKLQIKGAAELVSRAIQSATESVS